MVVFLYFSVVSEWFQLKSRNKITMSNQPQNSEITWSISRVDDGEEQQLHEKMIMMKMRVTMTTEVRDSISCLRVATEPIITKEQRKLREVARPILHTLCSLTDLAINMWYNLGSRVYGTYILYIFYCYLRKEAFQEHTTYSDEQSVAMCFHLEIVHTKAKKMSMISDKYLVFFSGHQFSWRKFLFVLFRYSLQNTQSFLWLTYSH